MTFTRPPSRGRAARGTRAIGDRIYADFVMPSRMTEYRLVLEAALEAGYSIVPIDEPPGPGANASGPGGALTLVLRHDIDTDPATARRMWRIERSMQIRSSYFFRLSTVDLELMRAISEAGGQVGYHYEELATVAKRRHVRSREAMIDLLPEARDVFRSNLERLRARTGLALSVAAAHGDFLNRRLGVSNQLVLADQQFREAVRIVGEAYDERLVLGYSTRHADTLHPTYWIPEPPITAIQRREQVVSVLVHPRHWHVARRVNAADDLARLLEEVRFRLARA